MPDEFGYAGNILKIDLSTGKIENLPTAYYADRFVGGRGIAAKIYWDLVPPDAKAFDPENCLIFANGPLAGFGGLASSRWQVCSKSPAITPEQFSYCSLGGHWGAQLKFAGYDGIIIQGASEKPVYIVIKDNEVEIKDAAHLWQRGAAEVREDIKREYGREMRVVASGQAGDNLVPFASLLADNDASGSSGAAAVMGSKKLKAIAVRGSGKVKAADPVRLRGIVEHVRKLKQLPPGTLERIAPKGSRTRRESCFGCIGSCTGRLSYEAEDGTRGKVMCQSSNFYIPLAKRYNGEVGEIQFFANRICDNYGLNTMVLDPIIELLSRCNRAGILNEEITGLPLSKMGSLEFIEDLARKISFREGFGDVLANGPTKAAEIIGQGAPELIFDYVALADHSPAYCPRMYITTGIFYAVEPRQPIQQLHEVSRLLLKWVAWYRGIPGAYMSTDLLREIGKTFWGSELAADFSTYEGKALAAKKIQDRQYAKESLIVCDFSWPITEVECGENHLGDPSIESQIFSAVTGRETDEGGLNEIGERVFNLQRAVLTREGHFGRKADEIGEIFYKVPLNTSYMNRECWAPGQEGEPFKKVGTVVDREKFEQVKTEYYQLRGWDPETGLQTVAKLRKLGLGDIAEDLVIRGCAI